MESADTLERRWIGDQNALQIGVEALTSALDEVVKPLFVVEDNGQMAVSHQGAMQWEPPSDRKDSVGLPLLGFAPPLSPSQLGDAGFKRDLRIKYAYIVGAMANGITSVEMVSAAGKAGMVGFFGAGGLSLEQIETAIRQLHPLQKQFRSQ